MKKGSFLGAFSIMMMDKVLFVISFCMFLSCALIEAVPNDTLITQVPGFNGSFPSKQYSGYVSIEDKNLYYYFVVSERDPVKDPVVLWLNGGPGCSSFDGFVYEHGPFNFEEGNTKGSLPKLHLNPYSWSKVSNIIYLDSPAGVGYSYATNDSAYETGDYQTAADTHAFLLKWFSLYPEFVSNPFYISGESYAGVYVPTLVSAIDKGLKGGLQPTINLKGYLIGNPVADRIFDDNALVSFAHGMALISDEIFKEVESACGGNYSTATESCGASLGKVRKAIGGLNIYDILEPCYHHPKNSSGNSSLPLSFQQLGVTERPHPVRTRMFGRAWPYNAPVKDGDVPLWPQLEAEDVSSVPCINDEVARTWLNDAGVRKAIHAETDNVAGPWQLCTARIRYKHDAGSMIPYHKNLTAQGYRALIYSGDHDMCVPFTGTQAWTSSLGYKITIEWRAWMSDDQVSGYLQGYDHNLTFLTIKGAGHTVPEYKPREALDFYTRWLDQQPI